MSVARKRRRYLRLSRYSTYLGRFDQRREWDAASTVTLPWALSRAGRPFYRNGARLPYGWQPNRPMPRLLRHELSAGIVGPPGECGVEYMCGTVLDGFDSLAAAEAVGCGHRVRGGGVR